MEKIRGSLSLHYPGFSLDMRFEIPDGAVTVVMGPSGSGKSTFLRCLAGLERAHGELFFLGKSWQGAQGFTPTHERDLGFVFQDGNLFPHLSVEGNLRLGLERASCSRFEWAHVMEVFGLTKLLCRDALSLSGGERQRVAIARALLSSPKLLLMDEPLSGLDMQSKSEVMEFLEKMKSEFEVPTIYVTHSILEASQIGDFLLLMETGRCKEFGAVEKVFSNDFVLRESLSGLFDLQRRFGVNL